jgi:hypothetical protein
MSQLYKGPGGNVHSDFVFHALPETEGNADLVMYRDDQFPAPGELIRKIPLHTGSSDAIRISSSEDGLQWSVDRVGVFHVDPAGDRLRYRLAPDCSIADAESLLLGPILGIAAALRGRAILHASAVVLNGHAIAFTGPRTTGKSTLAFAFASSGCQLISDDLLELEDRGGELVAVPYVPVVRVWPSTLELLDFNSADSSRVVSWADKLQLPSTNVDVARGRVPAGVIYVLARGEGSFTEPVITTKGRVDSMLTIQGAFYGAEWAPIERAARSLNLAVAIAEQIPVRLIEYRSGRHELATLMRAIERDVEHL